MYAFEVQSCKEVRYTYALRQGSQCGSRLSHTPAEGGTSKYLYHPNWETWKNRWLTFSLLALARERRLPSPSKAAAGPSGSRAWTWRTTAVAVTIQAAGKEMESGYKRRNGCQANAAISQSTRQALQQLSVRHVHLALANIALRDERMSSSAGQIPVAVLSALTQSASRTDVSASQGFESATPGDWTATTSKRH